MSIKDQGKAQSSSASALGIDEEESSPVFVNKKGELCLSIRGKPGANETRVTGKL